MKRAPSTPVTTPAHSSPPLTASYPAALAAAFPYRDYLTARATLEEAVKRGPFYGLVEGRSGTGKTSLSRDLETALDHHRYQIFYWSASKVSPLGFARHIARSVRAPQRRSVPETHQHIVDTLKAQPFHLIAWIDEAQRIPADVLEELRILAEFDRKTPQVMTVVFSGPPEIRPILESSALFALRRRITVECKLEGLHRDELDAFLVHHFTTTDARRISAAHKDELFDRSRGTPGVLEHILRHALSRSGKGAVTDEHLREAFDALGI